MARKRGLRTGFSTGTASAAAAKAALWLLLCGEAPGKVDIDLPAGQTWQIDIHDCRMSGEGRALATVIKDAGDDPDVTHKAEIQALVELGGDGIELKGGKGVGRVTLPGLEVPPGEPAINPVPRKMIRQAVGQAWKQCGKKGDPACRITIMVPKGQELAKKTLNPRLGILDGISILGTSGLVRPMSHEAYTATIKKSLQVARAQGLDEVVLTTGGRSEKHAMSLKPGLSPAAFIQIADYFGFALQEAAGQGVKRLGLVVFFGKAVKQAQGLECTHAHKAAMVLGWLAGWLEDDGAPQELLNQVRAANTARHALETLRETGRMDLVASVGRRMVEQAGALCHGRLEVWALILDYDGSVLFEGGEYQTETM